MTGPQDFLACSDRAEYYAIVKGNPDECAMRIDAMVETLSAFAHTNLDVCNTKLQLSVAFGVYRLEGDRKTIPHPTLDNIHQRLDFALYKARQGGPGTAVQFNPGMEKELHIRSIIEVSMRDAIRENQIVPHFQPFVNLETSQVAGFEVLARWYHPVLGNIPPSDFIAIAEGTGNLSDLTLSILKQACRTARNWPPHLKMAINAFPTDLGNASVVKAFVATLQETGMNTNQIEVEITENAIIENAENFIQAIGALKDNGISISIDDFGTGYSSLQNLRILQFDKIKIDQSFIKDMASNPDSRSIVKMMIGLSKSLNLPITAEGIETEQTSKLMLELGCTFGQGFLFAKAMPSEDIAGFMRNWEQKTASTAHEAENLINSLAG